MNPFAILGFAGSLLSASATIARGKEIKRQKEMEGEHWKKGKKERNRNC